MIVCRCTCAWPFVPYPWSSVLFWASSVCRLCANTLAPPAYSYTTVKWSHTFPNFVSVRACRPPIPVAATGSSPFITHAALTTPWMACSTKQSPDSHV